MEFKLGAVEKAAQEQNGWHAIAISKAKHQPKGTVPSGTVAFVKQDHRKMGGVGNCGTAQWSIPEHGGVIFYWGHYDLHRDEAMEDFAERTAKL